MAVLRMERRASDNKHLHKDFHVLADQGIAFVGEKYVDNGVREYLYRFICAYYAPLIEAIKKRGLVALKEHIEKIYEIEEASDAVKLTLTEDELLVEIKYCPAVEFMKSVSHTPSKWYIETTRTVNETIADKTNYGFELLLRRRYRKGSIQVLQEVFLMISCTEFIPLYSELFKYIEDKSGYDAVIRYWQYVSDVYVEPRLGALVAEKGIAGCREYWSKSLNEEAADFIMTYDDEKEEFSIIMRYCPSRGLLNSLTHMEPYHDYCGHCTVLYSRVLKKYGICQEFDLSKVDKAKCSAVCIRAGFSKSNV